MTGNLSAAAGSDHPSGMALDFMIRGDWEPGRTAYDAYIAALDPLLTTPPGAWDSLPGPYRAAWEQAADAVLDQAGRGQSAVDPESTSAAGSDG